MELTTHEKAVDLMKMASAESDPELKSLMRDAAKNLLGVDLSAAKLAVKKSRPGYLWLRTTGVLLLFVVLLVVAVVLLIVMWGKSTVIVAGAWALGAVAVVAILVLFARGAMSEAGFTQMFPSILNSALGVKQPTHLDAVNAESGRLPAATGKNSASSNQALPAPRVDFDPE